MVPFLPPLSTRPAYACISHLLHPPYLLTTTQRSRMSIPSSIRMMNTSMSLALIQPTLKPQTTCWQFVACSRWNPIIAQSRKTRMKPSTRVETFWVVIALGTTLSSSEIVLWPFKWWFSSVHLHCLFYASEHLIGFLLPFLLSCYQYLKVKGNP